MEKSLFIRALQYAGDHPDGFTIKQLENYLGTSEWGPLRNEFVGQHKNNLFYQSGWMDNGDRYWLTAEGHKLLYEINEIQEAGENAKSARFISIISIFAAIIIPLAVAAIW